MAQYETRQEEYKRIIDPLAKQIKEYKNYSHGLSPVEYKQRKNPQTPEAKEKRQAYERTKKEHSQVVFNKWADRKPQYEAPKYKPPW
jgi:hypothetical protein